MPSRVLKGADNTSASVVEARGALSTPYMFLPEIVGVLLLRQKRLLQYVDPGWFFVPVGLTQWAAKQRSSAGKLPDRS